MKWFLSFFLLSIASGPVQARFCAPPTSHQPITIKLTAADIEACQPKPNSQFYRFRNSVAQQINVDPSAMVERYYRIWEELQAPISTAVRKNFRISQSYYSTHTETVGKPEKALFQILFEHATAQHEFAAFIFQTVLGEQEILLVIGTIGGVTSHPGQKEFLNAYERRGFHLKAHLHNHPFVYRERIVGGVLVPSPTDVRSFKKLHMNHGLNEAWLTNGFHTFRMPVEIFSELSEGSSVLR